MKKSFQKLSMEIKKNSIVVEDRTGEKKYKKEFILTETNKKEMFDQAKNWLWNMGLYNGQANAFMNKFNIILLEELGLITKTYNMNDFGME